MAGCQVAGGGYDGYMEGVVLFSDLPWLVDEGSYIGMCWGEWDRKGLEKKKTTTYISAYDP
jgi:hypothetical protein